MVYARGRKKRSPGSVRRKKVYRARKRVYRRKRTTIKYATMGIPTFKNIKLGYAWSGTVTAPTAAATSTQVFKLNSLFDPDRTGTGVSTFGTNWWKDVYQWYKVRGAKVNCTISWQNPGTSDTPFYAFFRTCLVDPGSSATLPSGNNEELKQDPNCQWRLLSNNNANVINTNIHFKRYYSIAKCWGIPYQSVETDPNYNGVIISSDPPGLVYLQIFLRTFDGTALGSTENFNITFEMTQYCKLFKRVDEVTHNQDVS